MITFHNTFREILLKSWLNPLRPAIRGLKALERIKPALRQSVLRFVYLVTFSLVLLGCDKQVEPVASEHVGLFGRIDYSDKRSPVIIWQGSRIEFTVKNADYVDILFSRKSGQVYFDLLLDGTRKMFTPQLGANRIQLNRKGKPQHIVLLKRNEAATGSIAFDGVELPSGGKTVKLEQRQKKLRFLFFGDSITAGACNEDGAQDQWQDMSTHNALKSYAALTAAKFSAEYQNISVSGMGVSMGYTQSKFPETWNKLYPLGSSDVAVDDDYQPNFIFINLGENDDSWSAKRGSQFPIDYDERYIAMVKKMREQYADATIVILRGGMRGGKKSKRLIEPWDKVVKQLEENDENIRHYVFKHWSSLHPRVSDHEIMAAELTTWLRKNAGI